jgi:hypothetical protein
MAILDAIAHFVQLPVKTNDVVPQFHLHPLVHGDLPYGGSGEDELGIQHSSQQARSNIDEGVGRVTKAMAYYHRGGLGRLLARAPRQTRAGSVVLCCGSVAAKSGNRVISGFSCHGILTICISRTTHIP